MVYELLAYNTDRRYDWDVRYREYTRSKRRADRFKAIPKLQFSNSGHGIVFVVREHEGKRKPRVRILAGYVREHMRQAPAAPKEDN